jgi:UDP-2,3-diacylglucosamine hydrolase
VDDRDILLIADSHLAREPGDEAPMIDLLDRLSPERFRALYLLGDVFHYLIGDRKFLTPGIEATFDAFRRLRERGIPTWYVEGNRDFYLKGSFLEPVFTSVDLAYTIETPAGRYFLTHGDLINDRDYPYRFWRFMSKNPVAFAAMKAVPERAARKLVSGVEAKLSKSNFKHKYRIPEERILSFAAKRWDEGDRTVLLGHFHREWRRDEERGSVAVVPAFCETGRVGTISAAGVYATRGAGEVR